MNHQDLSPSINFFHLLLPFVSVASPPLVLVSSFRFPQVSEEDATFTKYTTLCKPRAVLN